MAPRNSYSSTVSKTKRRKHPSSIEEAIANTPSLTEGGNLYLPLPIRLALSHLDYTAEKDVFVSSGLGVLSGCLPNVEGLYHKHHHAPNLYVCIIAPAGSGKRFIEWGRKLGEGVDYYLREGHRPFKSDFAFDAPEESFEASDDDDSSEDSLYIPGDASTSAFVQTLDANGGYGIIVETEIDTLTRTQKHDWGKISDLLRKAYPHETISLRRVNDREIVIRDPRLSMILGGTPRQIKKLIRSPENGLFSRFTFLAFLPKDPFLWKDPRPNPSQTDPQSELETAAEKVLDLWLALSERDTSLKVKWSNRQWDRFNIKMTENKERLVKQSYSFGPGVSHRTGVRIYRLSLALGVWQAWENGQDLSTAPEIQLSDKAFVTAGRLGLKFSRHAEEVLSAYKPAPRPQLPEQDQELFSQLSKTFKTREAVQTGEEVGFSERTVKRRLNRWIKMSLLKKVKRGHYRKMND